MHYREIATEDIDELSSWGTNWDNEYIQLSRGQLGFSSREVHLPDVTIAWNSYAQAILFRERLQVPALVFGVVLDASGNLRYLGRETNQNEGAILHPDVAHEYRTYPDTESLIVVVAPPLLKKLGWRFLAKSFLQISTSDAGQLIKTCEDVTALAMTTESSAIDDQMDSAQRDRVIIALRNVSQP